MLEIAKKEILNSGDFLSLAQTAQLLGVPPTNLDEWEAEGLGFQFIMPAPHYFQSMPFRPMLSTGRNLT